MWEINSLCQLVRPDPRRIPKTAPAGIQEITGSSLTGELRTPGTVVKNRSTTVFLVFALGGHGNFCAVVIKTYRYFRTLCTNACNFWFA